MWPIQKEKTVTAESQNSQGKGENAFVCIMKNKMPITLRMDDKNDRNSVISEMAHK